MERRKFIATSVLASAALMSLNKFTKVFEEEEEVEKVAPLFFIGHGSPMNAIEDNEFTKGWKKQAESLEKPKAILCISAHWETEGTQITAMKNPQTIHDFGGFPEELFNTQYPAPGSPEHAKQIIENIKKTTVAEDHNWGLDHGTWSVLKPMFPNADIPVMQLSIDYTKDLQYHYDLAKELAFLRKKGVMIMGSGNIVHNLSKAVWADKAYDWTIEFDTKIKEAIDSGDHKKIIDYKSMGESAKLSVPTNEHFIPLIYILGLKGENENIFYFNEKNTMGSISMRSVKFG